MLIAAFEIHVRRPVELAVARRAPPRGSSRSRTRRRGCRARARTSCRRTTGTSVRPARTPRSGARTTRRRRTARRPPPRVSMSAGVSTASPHDVQSSAGIGTPHARCREMHQSGRFATMLKMRSRPHGGNPRHFLVDRMPRRLAQRARLAVRARDRRLAVQSRRTTATSRGRSPGCGSASSAGTVLERLPMPEPAAVVERLLDVRIRVEHALAAEQLDRVEEMAAGVRPARRCRGRTSRPVRKSSAP